VPKAGRARLQDSRGGSQREVAFVGICHATPESCQAEGRAGPRLGSFQGLRAFDWQQQSPCQHIYAVREPRPTNSLRPTPLHAMVCPLH
jgi:hypothetical protein